MSPHQRGPLGLLFLLGALYLSMLAGLMPRSAPAASDSAPLVVRIRAASEEDRRRLAATGIDLLEMLEGEDRFALVTPAERDALLAEGWEVQPDAVQSALLRRSSLADFDPAYRSVEQTEQLLRDLVAQYPSLASLVDYGDSWDKTQPEGRPGYDLLALRITNSAIGGPKPTFFLMAAIHARELTTSELATRFAQLLLEGYGADPDISWMLDEHEVVIVPIANPDGRKIAEQGLYQRKNLNDSAPGTCPQPATIGLQEGVDLNRNSSHAWGTVDSPDLSPCYAVYPGTSAASEPETAALQALIAQIYGVRPSPGAGQAASENSDGVLITLHSYSNLVLWPWGHTNAQAPNAAGLARLGQQLAAFNGYTPYQSINLYPTSGTTDDWSYAALGLASYTFEVGPSGGACGGFMPPYSCLDGGSGGSFWPKNRPALLYALRVARAPYSQPGGPQASIDSLVRSGSSVTITVSLDGRGQAVQAAELSLGGSTYRGAASIALQPSDGAFDEPLEQASAVFATDLGVDTYLLARGQAVNSLWGPPDAAWLPDPQAPPPQQQRLWLPIMASDLPPQK
jgi:carboxypeptidase T